MNFTQTLHTRIILNWGTCLMFWDNQFYKLLIILALRDMIPSVRNNASDSQLKSVA